jgi:xanthine dehydrogenase YagR molybdenum-binding subunit
MANTWPKEPRLIGKKTPRLDGPDKATGRAKYSYDINPKGLLHAAMLRCPHAHAKVTKIDTADAEKMPGVKAIYLVGSTNEGTVAKTDADKKTITFLVKEMGKDVEKIVDVPADAKIYRQNRVVQLGDIKEKDKVKIESKSYATGRELFYAGEEILALAADTEEHAADALRGVKVEYEVLEHLVREEDALKAGNGKTAPPVQGNRDNVRPVGDVTKGNPDNAFKDGDVVVHEGTYGVPVICHQCLESHGCVAQWDEAGENLTVWMSTQAVPGIAGQFAGRFGIPTTQVKCITHYMGGGFGSKFNSEEHGFAAAELALRAKAPVKLMLDRAAEITTAGNRPSAYGTVKIAASKEGKLVAYQAEVYGTPGVSNAPSVNVNGLPYVYLDAVPNAKAKQQMIRLNSGRQQAMRAPGHPQMCVLTDCPLDDLAAKLNMDPMQLRLKNLPPSDPKITNKLDYRNLRESLYTEEIKKAAELAEWEKKWHPPGKGPEKGPIKHGIGMALHTWGGAGGPPNDIKVTITSDGSVLVESSTQDLGTGARTVLAIVIAEVLGLEVKDVTVRIGESPYGRSTGSGGSTTTPGIAPAALNAGSAARDALFEKIAARLMVNKDDLTIEPGKLVDKTSKKSWSWKEASARLGMDTIVGTGNWTQGLSLNGVGGVQVAEVHVDTETGVVRCTRIVAVQDCGLIINKQGCESQTAGGVIMGVNYALFEERVMDARTGRQMNPDMEFYKLGGIEDMPEIVVYMHDMPERGVIGIGEPPTIATCAAISNAVFNAIGVRVPNAPFTPERVLAALAKKA